MMEMKKETQEKIQQLQLMEQNIQQFLVQKQQFQSQLIELESALGEASKVEEAYKIVGNIMVMTKSKELKKDLEQKKEVVELRIKSLEKQENSIKEKTKKLQEEVLGDMKE